MAELDWVRMSLYLAKSGESESTVRRKIADGVYVQGRHWRNDPYAKKLIWINQKAVQEWLYRSPALAV